MGTGESAHQQPLTDNLGRPALWVLEKQSRGTLNFAGGQRVAGTAYTKSDLNGWGRGGTVSILAEGQDIRNLEGAESITMAPLRRSNWAAGIRRRLLVTDFILIGLTVSAAQLARFGLDDGPVAAIPSDNTFVSIILGTAWLGALGINQSRAGQALGTGNWKRRIQAGHHRHAQRFRDFGHRLNTA